jgi:FkbM family methyltransferase
MQRSTAAAQLGKALPVHRARSFAVPPGPAKAVMLLAELATASCAFAPVPADKPLALYGAGNLGRMAREFLNAVGIDPVMVIDRDAKRLAQEPFWSGVRLVHPDDITADEKSRLRLAACVVTSPYVPLEQSLLALGFTDIVPFYDVAESFRAQHPLSNGWFAAPLTTLEQKKTLDVLAQWDDNLSRSHHLAFLAWRRLREEWTFDAAPVSTGDRFFIPEVINILADNEFFLDGGANDGSVSQTFIQQTKGAFAHIAAIEPDPANRQRLKANLPNDKRVSLYDCALAEAEGQAIFHDGLGYASQLSPTGKMTVATRPLDALGLSPTFLKLHLEGAELPALKGAEKTLLSTRPIVAVTVYHNADGIWKTPLWLMETLPDYRFLFRNHSWCGTGAVVYAIPRERMA